MQEFLDAVAGRVGKPGLGSADSCISERSVCVSGGGVAGPRPDGFGMAGARGGRLDQVAHGRDRRTARVVCEAELGPLDHDGIDLDLLEVLQHP